MLCKNPYPAGGMIYFGCGQCNPCRINKKREKISRCILEWLTSGVGSFCTLTYADEHMPYNDAGQQILVRNHPKSLFKAITRETGEKPRYFVCGEYGEQTQRPHYHLLLFGLNMMCADYLLKKHWKKGHVHIGEISQQSIGYNVGYVTKKMTAVSDPRLLGRTPEYGVGCQRPALGASAIPAIINTILTPEYTKHMLEVGDVPTEVKLGKQSILLDRYMKNKIREELGMPDEFKQESTRKWLQEKTEEMLALRQKYPNTISDKERLLEETKQKILNMEAKFNIKTPIRTL